MSSPPPTPRCTPTSRSLGGVASGPSVYGSNGTTHGCKSSRDETTRICRTLTSWSTSACGSDPGAATFVLLETILISEEFAVSYMPLGFYKDTTQVAITRYLHGRY